METHNKFFVGLHNDKTVILRPPRKTMPWDHFSPSSIVLSNDDALLLAAWLVACADPGGSKFLPLLASIK